MLTYAGSWLDRAAGLRRDQEWTAAMLGSPAARLVALWRDECLVAGDPPRPVALSPRGSPRLLSGAEPVFLGMDGGGPVFAVDLSGLDREEAVALTGAARTADLRSIVGGLPPAEAATQAYARAITHWHRNNGFCGVCGAATEAVEAGHARSCRNSRDCGKLHFPRIEPAVIVLVEAGDGSARCLLGRHRGSGEDDFSTLAGFLEVGESLEDAVRREVAEESGVKVGEVRYEASQPWPFPAGLMVAFTARSLTMSINVDGDELVDARWFTAAELRQRRPTRPDATNRFLVDAWLSRNS